jgi:predicted SAM-dependent methyltransferase
METRPLKIQFGSGSNILEGWENHDSDLDITKLPLPFENDSVSEVMAEHLVEHISTPDFFRFLMECHRILKHDGTLLLCVPVLDGLDDVHARDIILGHGHLAAYTMFSLKKILDLTPFRQIYMPKTRPEICGHWKVIGEEKDDKETCRLLCIK